MLTLGEALVGFGTLCILFEGFGIGVVAYIGGAVAMYIAVTGGGT